MLAAAMSDIAQALAKAKERVGHTTAPFLAGGPAVPVELNPKRDELLRKARRQQRFWLTLGAIAIPLTAFILWINVTAKPETSKPAPPPTVKVANSSTPPTSAPSTTETNSPATSTTRPAATIAPPPLTSPVLRAEIAASVAAFAVSAVMAGETPRVVIDGRSYRAGETIQGEIRFVGVVDGQLHFVDSRGAIYARRF